MLYLLDANILIDANRDYYPIDKVPEFWAWLMHHGNQGNIKICLEIYEELTNGTDDLSDLLKMDSTKKALLLGDESNQTTVSKVVSDGYAPDLTDIEIQTVGRDPFLIAHAMADIPGRCVVTAEHSAPSRKRQNRQMPDVCADFGVTWCNAFALFRALDFSTAWES